MVNFNLIPVNPTRKDYEFVICNVGLSKDLGTVLSFTAEDDATIKEVYDRVTAYQVANGKNSSAMFGYNPAENYLTGEKTKKGFPIRGIRAVIKMSLKEAHMVGMFRSIFVSGEVDQLTLLGKFAIVSISDNEAGADYQDVRGQIHQFTETYQSVSIDLLVTDEERIAFSDKMRIENKQIAIAAGQGFGAGKPKAITKTIVTIPDAIPQNEVKFDENGNVVADVNGNPIVNI